MSTNAREVALIAPAGATRRRIVSVFAALIACFAVWLSASGQASASTSTSSSNQTTAVTSTGDSKVIRVVIGDDPIFQPCGRSWS